MKAGITGHQNIGSNETIKWVTNVLVANIKELSIDFGLTSLAIGADQLFAETLRGLHIRYVAIIPCEGYEQTFTTTNDLRKYKSLLQSSSEIIKLPFDKPSEEAFFEAGKHIVNSSDMVIAIWDGQAAKGLGGTGDIVNYALSIKRSILHINPITRTVNRL